MTIRQSNRPVAQPRPGERQSNRPPAAAAPPPDTTAGLAAPVKLAAPAPAPTVTAAALAPADLTAGLSGSPSSPPLYVTSDILKASLSMTGETFADADITAALTAASRGIELVCHRRFYSDADANQSRYYTPGTRRVLRIDDLLTLTEFATDPAEDGTFATVWTENTDFVLEPLNAAADNWPYTYIRRLREGNRWTRRPRSVRLTGMFGWATVPDDIVEATSLLASRLMRRVREAPFGLVGFAMDTGTGAVARLARQDPDVMMLAGPYIRQLVG